MLGRLFVAADDQPSSAQTAIVSYEFWQNRLRSDAGIVGKSILHDKFPVTVVGVLSPGFRFPTGKSHRSAQCRVRIFRIAAIT
jgi:putative ABC transport system permease protein